jgi:hypothetical protein
MMKRLREGAPVSVRVFLGGNELLGLRDSSYADPLIAICQAIGLDFTYRPDLECLFIASPIIGALVALQVEEKEGVLRNRLTRLLRGAGAQVVSAAGLIGRRYGDVALSIIVDTRSEAAVVRYPAGAAASRVLAANLTSALDLASLKVTPPRPELRNLGRGVPSARVVVAREALAEAPEVYAQSLFLGISRFLWWRMLADCQLRSLTRPLRNN